MARAEATDFLSNFRFFVEVVGLGGQTLNTIPSSNGVITAGFNTCSAPSLTEEAMDYREGHYIYTRKYPGIPTVADITLTRGVALSDGTMFSWAKDTVEGNDEYRADVYIYQFARQAKPQTTSVGNTTQMTVNLTNGGYAQYSLSNALPTEFKTSGDLDSTSGEVSVQELVLAVESFDAQYVAFTGTVGP
jgi:phage tail-like protein